MVSRVNESTLAAFEQNVESEAAQQSVAKLKELFKKNVEEPPKAVRRTSRRWQPPQIKRESSITGVSRSSSTVGQATKTPSETNSPEKTPGAISVHVNVTKEMVPVRLVHLPFDRDREVEKYRGLLKAPEWFKPDCTKDSVALQEELVGEAVSAMQTLFPEELEAYYRSTVLTEGSPAKAPDHGWYVEHFLKRIDQVLGPRGGGMDTAYMKSLSADKYPKFRVQWMSITIQNRLEPFLRHIGVIPRSFNIGEPFTWPDLMPRTITTEKDSLADSWLQLVNASTRQEREGFKRKREEKDEEGTPKAKRHRGKKPQDEPATPRADWKQLRSAKKERARRFTDK